jgi:hypothetical protein
VEVTVVWGFEGVDCVVVEGAAALFPQCWQKRSSTLVWARQNVQTFIAGDCELGPCTGREGGGLVLL